MPADLIKLEGMVFFGYHGVNEKEKVKGQKFVVDIDLFCDLRLAGNSDDLSDTINYSIAVSYTHLTLPTILLV